MKSRDETLQKLREQLRNWDEEIERLQAKMDAARQSLRAEYQERIDELRARRDEARGHLEELGRATGEAWNEARQGVDRAWEEMKRSLKRARDRLD